LQDIKVFGRTRGWDRTHHQMPFVEFGCGEHARRRATNGPADGPGQGSSHRGGRASSNGGRFSSHPADRLVRDLVQSGRPVTEQEIADIVSRLAGAPFPQAAQHHAKRLQEGQWSARVTVEQYVADLKTAVRHPTSRILVYKRRGGALAAALTETADAVAPDNLGPAPLPLLFVVFSAERGMIVTGYQASALATIGIPPDARWLK
jgi:hypothetical protein